MACAISFLGDGGQREDCLGSPLTPTQLWAAEAGAPFRVYMRASPASSSLPWYVMANNPRQANAPLSLP